MDDSSGCYSCTPAEGRKTKAHLHLRVDGPNVFTVREQEEDKHFLKFIGDITVLSSSSLKLKNNSRLVISLKVRIFSI